MRFLGDSILMPAETLGFPSSYTAPADAPWWEKLLDAGVAVTGSVFGGPEPVGRPTGYRTPIYSSAGSTGISTGILVAGAAVLVLLLMRKK